MYELIYVMYELNHVNSDKIMESNVGLEVWFFIHFTKMS